MHTPGSLVAIVEDDESMRKSIERLLQAHQYTTAAFASAEAFLQSTDVGDAVGLVLDIHLGGMSGIELRRRLAAMHSTIPVVFITAHDERKTHADSMALGCVDFLLKPFDSERLIRALGRGIAGQQSAGQCG